MSTFRAQGNLSPEKKKLLRELQDTLSISVERYQAEIRRVSNDEKLNTIAHYMYGPSNASEWIEEGKRLIPLLPRLVPQTAFIGLANATATHQMKENELMPPPTATQNKRKVLMKEREEQEAKRLREESQNITITRKPVPSVPRVKPVGSITTPSSKPTRIHLPSPTKLTIPSTAPHMSNAPRVILVTSTPGGGFVPVSTITSSSHTYSKIEKRPQFKTVVRGSVGDAPIVRPTVQKGVHSQKVYVVPSSSGKTSYTTIPVPGNLKGLQFSSAPSGMIIPGSNLAQSGLSIRAYPGNVPSCSKPNLIIMPSKANTSLPASTSSMRPIIVSSALTKSPQARLVTIRDSPTQETRTLKVSDVIAGPSSTVLSDKALQGKTKPSYNISNASNVIEIQATGDAIQNLMKKGTLSQDLLELVQKAVSMSGNQPATQPVVVQQTAKSNTTQSSTEIEPAGLQQSEGHQHQISPDCTISMTTTKTEGKEDAEDN